MKDKIKEFLSPSEDAIFKRKLAIFKRKLDDFRRYHVPERYNQIKLLDELNNPDIDHYISVSNRTDGKTFNYIHALMKIAIDYNLGITFLSRNMMLRQSYQELLDEIIEVSTIFDRKDFTFIRSQYYVRVDYKGQSLAIISDLNNAGELKYFSNFIKHYPIIIYDEFIALETDYLSDEWERLKTIYESIDRIEKYPLIGKPKIFYFGNAINFDSPIFSGLKLFNILERHEINTARIYHYEFNVMLEMHKNENANQQRNTRAFASDDDAMTTGEFKTNAFNIATEDDRNHIKKNPRVIYIKLKEDYLRIWFNRDSMKTILSIESRIEDDYTYNLLLKDNKENSIFLNEKYFDENHIKKIDKGVYLFENNFSKNLITSDMYELNMLKINKIIREFLRQDNTHSEIESKEKQFKDNYIEQTKRMLVQKMWE